MDKSVLPPFVYRAIGVISTFAVFACYLVALPLLESFEMDLSQLLLFSVTFIAGYVAGQFGLLRLSKYVSPSVIAAAYVGAVIPLGVTLALAFTSAVPISALYPLWLLAGIVFTILTEGWFLNLSISRGFASSRSLLVIGLAILVAFLLVAFIRPISIQIVMLIGLLALSAFCTWWLLVIRSEAFTFVRPEGNGVLPARIAMLVIVHGFVYGLLSSHLPHFDLTALLAILGFAVTGLLIYAIRFVVIYRGSIDLTGELVYVAPVLAFVIVATPQAVGWAEVLCVGITAGTFTYFLATSVTWLLRIARKNRELSSGLMLRIQFYIWLGIFIGILSGYIVGNAYCTSGACVILSSVYTTMFVMATLIGTRNVHLDEERLVVGTGPVEKPQGVAEIIDERLEGLAREIDLSPRESEVLKVFARKMDVEDTSAELVISPSTTRTHLHRIYSKLELNSVQALKEYLVGNDLTYL